jgi:2'-5' RNA ligase
VNDERARVFVALELPDAVREAVIDWRSRIVGAADELRPVPPAAMHVTLCFLGSVAARLAAEIGDACAAALGGARAIPLELGSGLWLPARRPHVLAIAIADPSAALGRIQATLAAALERGGWYAPETRPFLAHATVARVRRGARLRAGELPEPGTLGFDGSVVTLFRSRLGAAGARYEPERTIRLATR